MNYRGFEIETQGGQFVVKDEDGEIRKFGSQGSAYLFVDRLVEEGYSVANADLMNDLVNADIPDSGYVKDRTGNVVLTYHSHSQLVRWLVQEGIGSMEALKDKGYHIEPLQTFGREARNVKAKVGARRYGRMR